MSETRPARAVADVIARLDPAVSEVFQLSPSSAPEYRRAAGQEEHLL